MGAHKNQFHGNHPEIGEKQQTEKEERGRKNTTMSSRMQVAWTKTYVLPLIHHFPQVYVSFTINKLTITRIVNTLQDS